MSCRAHALAFTILLFGILVHWDPSAVVARDEPTPAMRFDTLGRPLPEGAIARLGGSKPSWQHATKNVSVLPGGDRFFLSTFNAIEEWDCRLVRKIKQVPFAEKPNHEISQFTVSTAGNLGVASVTKQQSPFSGLFGGSESTDHQLYLLDVNTGKWMPLTIAAQKDLMGLAITRDEREIIALSSNNGWSVWGIDDGQLRRRVPVDGSGVCHMELSADGQLLLIVREANKTTRAVNIEVFDFPSGRLEKTLPGLNSERPCVRFSRDGQLFAIGGESTIDVHERATGRVRHLKFAPASDQKPLYGVAHLAFSPDGRSLAAFVYRVGVHIWSLDDDKPPAIFPVTGFPDTLFFCNDSTVVFSKSGAFHQIDIATGRYLSGFPGHTDRVIDVAFGRSDGRIWTIDQSTICRWNAKSYSMEQYEEFGCTLKMICEPINSLLARDYSKARWPHFLVDVTSRAKRPLPSLEGCDEIELSPNGKILLCDNVKKACIDVWNIETGKCLSSIPRQERYFDHPTFFPNSQSIIVQQPHGVRLDRCLRTFDVNSGICTDTWRWAEHGSWGVGTDAVAVSPTGQRVYALQNYGSLLRVIDPTTGESAAEWKATAKQRMFPRMIVSPDGRWLAIIAVGRGHFDEIDIWDTLTGRHAANWKCESLSQVIPTRMAFSPDSSILVTAGKAALVWEIASLHKPALNEALDTLKLVQLWNDLNGDAKTAFQAIQKLVASPDSATTMIAKSLLPVPRGALQNVDAILGKLDSPQFADREKAVQQLTELGPAAKGAIERFLTGSPSPEARQRATRIAATFAAAIKRNDRAMEILELIGTPAARALLERLADGVPLPV